MKNFKKKLAELIHKHAKWRTDNTPMPDKLGHYYWGDMIDAPVGFIISLLAIFLLGFGYWALPFPFLTALIAGSLKEYSDGQGFGIADPEDIRATIVPSFKYILILILIISIK